MVAVIGAVVVTAGVVISFQTKLENATAAESAAATPAKSIEAIEKPTVIAEDNSAAVNEDELDLSEFGNPVHDTSLFTTDTEPAVIDENATREVSSVEANAAQVEPSVNSDDTTNTAPEAGNQGETNNPLESDISPEISADDSEATLVP